MNFNRQTKTRLAGLCAFLICFFMTAVQAVAADSVPAVHFEFPVKANGETCRTQRWQQMDISDEKELFLSLPFNTQDSELTVFFDYANKVSIDGLQVENGDNIPPLSGGMHEINIDDAVYSLRVFYLSDIPTAYITTESGSLDRVYSDKNYKEQAYMVIADGAETEYAGGLEYIKGRGNNTWTMPKRPFNIKTETKQDLFGMGKSKKWSLLANYNDMSGIRNKIACDYANSAGMKYNSNSHILDLYINGEYMGNYTLIERVEIGENRIEIYNLEKETEKANNKTELEKCSITDTRGKSKEYVPGSYKYVNVPENPENIEGGYLIEFEIFDGERYNEAKSGFITDRGQPILIKSPEYPSKEQVEYIREYYQDFENAVLDEDGVNSKGIHYSEYLDVESMAKMYVFQEYVKNLDAAVASFYFYKDLNGKLTAGPVWDFDHALGSHTERYERFLDDPEGYWVTDLLMYDGAKTFTRGIFSLLCGHTEFREMAAQQWEQYFLPESEQMLDEILQTGNAIRASMEADKTRWTKEGPRSYEESAVMYADSIEDIYNFMKNRRVFMNRVFTTDRFYVKYHSNGLDQLMIDYGVYRKGDGLYVRGGEYQLENIVFTGWNTMPDGSGDEYIPGQVYPVSDNITLYAQWKKISIFERIISFVYNIIH